jgi:hypothetical protein
MSNLPRFEVIDSSVDGYCACLQIGPVCASIERVDGMFVPSVSADEYSEPVAKGQGLRTPELAADAALLLAQGYLRTLMCAFSPVSEFGMRADCVVTL